MNLSTTADFLRYWAGEKPDHLAVVWAGGTLTYRELDDRSSQVANALLAEGVGAGDRVAYLDKNSPEQIELFFGAAKINAVPTPVNFRLAPPEVAFVVTDGAAKVFAVGEEFLAGVEKIEGELSSTRLVTIGAVPGRTSFDDWRSAHPATDPKAPVSVDDVAYQLYSSGTTGRPKGVQLTHANLTFGVGTFAGLLGLDSESVSMVAMPLYHIGGGGWALAGFRLGATNVLVREAIPSDLVSVIESERVTHAFLVPAVLQFMLAVPGVEERDFSSLRYLLYGASPISETVLAGSIRTFGCGFVQAYGLTESTGMVVYLPAEDHDLDGPNKQRLRAIGVPVPGMEVRVTEPGSTEELPPGQVGEICVKGPMVMKGYWNLPDATSATIGADGWMRTGDAGYSDQDGYFYIHDRVKDMIVSGGENIYPAELENVIMSHPAVADAAVIGVPSDKWGETPKAVVVLVAGAELTESDLIAYCRESLAGFKVPTSVDFAAELPRNPSGKVLKKDLRAPYWEGQTRLVG
jgi:long-chain acyl-CoA synthetase